MEEKSDFSRTHLPGEISCLYFTMQITEIRLLIYMTLKKNHLSPETWLETVRLNQLIHWRQEPGSKQHRNFCGSITNSISLGFWQTDVLFLVVAGPQLNTRHLSKRHLQKATDYLTIQNFVPQQTFTWLRVGYYLKPWTKLCWSPLGLYSVSQYICCYIINIFIFNKSTFLLYKFNNIYLPWAENSLRHNILFNFFI